MSKYKEFSRFIKFASLNFIGGLILSIISMIFLAPYKGLTIQDILMVCFGSAIIWSFFGGMMCYFSELS